MRLKDIALVLHALAIYFLVLMGLVMLSGCETTKYITDCTLIQPDNCN